MAVHKLGHHSGRFDNPKVAQGFLVVKRNCTLATHTEFADNQRFQALDKSAHAAGWGAWQHNQHGYDDYAITWDTDHWRPLDKAWKKLSDIPTYSTEGKLRSPLCAVAMLLESTKDKTDWGVITTHMPSHVAVWGGWRPRSSRTEQYHDAMQTLTSWTRELAKGWKNSGMIVVGDWNAPVEQPWFRRYLEKGMPAAWKVMPGNPKPPVYPDTHDNRCIDWAMLGPKVAKRNRAYTKTVPDSDHKAVFYSVVRTK